MKQAYKLRTKHKSKLLFAMMNALAGEDASIYFEGRLSNMHLVKKAGGRFAETEVLRRRKLQPCLYFLVLRLTPASLSNIEKAIDPKVAFNRDAGIVHVQIEKHGQIAFAAYDQFRQDSVVAYPAVPIALLNELVAKRVLYSFDAG
jgi:hypothetical protein